MTIPESDLDLSKCFDRLDHDLIMASIRRRLRAKQLSLWKKPGRLHRRLRQLGYRGDFVAIRMRSWRSSVSHLASWAIPNAWLRDLGLFDLASVPTGVLPQVT